MRTHVPEEVDPQIVLDLLNAADCDEWKDESVREMFRLVAQGFRQLLAERDELRDTLQYGRNGSNWPSTVAILEGCLRGFPAGRAFLSRWTAEEKRADEAEAVLSEIFDDMTGHPEFDPYADTIQRIPISASYVSTIAVLMGPRLGGAS